MVTYDITYENSVWVVRVRYNHGEQIKAMFTTETYKEAIEWCLANIEYCDVVDFEILSHKTASDEQEYVNIHLDYIEDPANNTIVMDTLVNAYLDGLTGKAISTLGSTAYAGEFVEREFEYENPFQVLEFCARNEVTENDYGMLYRWTNTDCTYIERVNERDVYLAIEDMAEDIVKDFDTYNLWEKVGE